MLQWSIYHAYHFIHSCSLKKHRNNFPRLVLFLFFFLLMQGRRETISLYILILWSESFLSNDRHRLLSLFLFFFYIFTSVKNRLFLLFMLLCRAYSWTKWWWAKEREREKKNEKQLENYSDILHSQLCSFLSLRLCIHSKTRKKSKRTYYVYFTVVFVNRQQKKKKKETTKGIKKNAISCYFFSFTEVH